MNPGREIKQVNVYGLQDIFNYELKFPSGSDTIIIIAPNGHGKTALLSLIKDCVTLNLRRAANHTFAQLDLIFQDNTKWIFTRYFDNERLNLEAGRRLRSREEEAYLWRNTHINPQSGHRVDLKRFDTNGNEIQETAPNFDDINPRTVARALSRLPFLSMESSSYVRDIRSNELFRLRDAAKRFYPDISAEPQIKELLSASSPSAVWPNITEIDCVFIETQRLLYARHSQDDNDKSSHQEEILRQARSLSQMLQTNYSDYAATSQALDRSFPNRLIARARLGLHTDLERLQKSLADVEKKRAALTEAGILDDQDETILAKDDAINPNIVDALQIYVEDSQRKLNTYDAIFPKISAFRDLMNKKLKPKRLTIGRDFGAAISRDGNSLRLDGLSSGEKHEFIMLFKLIFETPSHSLVLIDEPEISLHVRWQMEFMSDLRRIQSTNPFQSIIATHSPQIIQGFTHLIIDLADQVK